MPYAKHADTSNEPNLLGKAAVPSQGRWHSYDICQTISSLSLARKTMVIVWNLFIRSTANRQQCLYMQPAFFSSTDSFAGSEANAYRYCERASRAPIRSASTNMRCRFAQNPGLHKTQHTLN